MKNHQKIPEEPYYKSVFRLLPEATPGVTVDVLAETFLDKTRRFLAEREIERRSGLSLGSIVIHCPKPEGPAKIANILITSQKEGARETRRLRKIGDLHPSVFLKHQMAVQALEEMYRSTWRLVVSAAPPHTHEWKTISEVASNVLYEIVRKGDPKGELPKNDENMTREIEVSLAPKDSARDGKVLQIIDESGDEMEMPASKLSFLQQIGNLVETHEVFRDVFGDHTLELVGDTRYDRAKAKLEAILDSKSKTRHASEATRKRASKELVPPDRTVVTVVSEQQEAPVAFNPGGAGDEEVELDVVMSEVDHVVDFYRAFVRESALDKLFSMRGRFHEELESSPIPRAIIVNRLRELIPPLLPGERVECNRAEESKIAEPLLRILAAKA